MNDPALFKWPHFEADIILCAVRWYLRYALSYRDVEELLQERGVSIDHTTVFRWVQRYAPELDQRCRPRLKRTNDSYRVDETYIKIKKQWHYLYRAVDSTGATLDFMLSATRDAAAAEQFFRDDPQWEVCASSADDKPAASERPHGSGVPLTMPCEHQPGDHDD
jgi:transposase, IS6 family